MELNDKQITEMLVMISSFREESARDEREKIIEIIKGYSADNDDLDNVWKTCEDLIKLVRGFA